MNKILTLKRILLVVIVAPFLFSCSKNEGCNFNEATNYDSSASIDDGSCTFTNFTFYADEVFLNGKYISKIDMKIDDELIGSFDGREVPGNACGRGNTKVYMPISVEQFSWTSEIHLPDTIIYTSGEERTSSKIECLEINVLP